MFIPDAGQLNPIEAARQQDEQALQQAQQPEQAVEQQPVEQQVAQPVEQVEQAIAEVYPQQPPTSGQSNRYSDREVNMRVMRERAEQAERRAMELERAMWNQQKPKETQQADYEDETLIEGKHLKKYDQTVQSMRQELEETKKQLANFNTTSAELQLRAKYSDFDSIVNDDNIERLAKEKPSLYRSILANPDLRDKGESAYEAIKVFLNPKAPQSYEQADRRIADNKAKPKASPTVAPQASDSPLSRAGDYDRRSLSDARKNELYEEMRRYRQ